MSIQEVWEALEQVLTQIGPYATVMAQQDAARNLALALLDELTAVDAGLCCPADAEFVAGVRAQIERLGKEGSDVAI